MFKTLTIKTRLIFVIGFLAIELIAGFAIGILNLEKANGALESMYTDRLKALAQLGDVERAMLRNQVLIGKATQPGAAVGEIVDQMAANTAIVTKSWTEYAATRMDANEKRAAEKFTASRAAFVNGALQPIVTALRAGDIARATELMNGPMHALAVPMGKDIDALVQIQVEVARADYQRSQEIVKIVRLVCVTGLALGLVIAAVLGWRMVRAIVRPLEEAVKIAGAVAQGDLTQKIEVRSNDETGRLMAALKDMNDSLVEIVTRVRAGTDTIATASSEIADGNLDLSSRTEQQAGSLEETASSMEELTSTVKQNADNARQANVLAGSASTVAGKGGAVVAQVVETMGAINSPANKIVEIISVIDGIAFQTNILALNAAVEAARAGEQGRGFAVVAGEVRNLAQRSAAAAKEIKLLIDDSVEKVHHGAALVDQAGATMNEIVHSVGRVTDIMAEISAASQEQNAGIEQVNSAIAQMDQATQQNAALVEEASAAAQSLQQEATILARTVGAFRIEGSAPLSAPARQTLAAPVARTAAPVRLGKPASAKAVSKLARAASAPKATATAGDGWEEF
ncbi:methyl-accepting chemotaxis protein [Massilia sp. Se16.2.3]|uniref:methyl-accepting chemotaxis protein n=1 Tax=Massilia sp. Se16.2.3 TaxID=2709303 RepID=UPI0015FF51F0|nr:methyl-accepting chemotaxis protein [Massilia sp. Se16.2.3]QNA99403.1 HAMP domain-containing protein [Massilia sp. Se16.2.3]